MHMPTNAPSTTGTMSMGPMHTMSMGMGGGSMGGGAMGGGSMGDGMMHMPAGMMMGMQDMAMTFFTSTTTPLYAMNWMPDMIGQYTGTCIFLIIFSAIFRALLAIRVNFYPILRAADNRRHGGLLYQPYRDEKAPRDRWRTREAIMIGFMDMVLAGVGYLLMIAVMTMNVGYFMSVLAGIFAGSVLFGRFVSGPSC